jgi:hypothetical protein
MSDNAVLGVIKKYWYMAALVLIVLIALWYRMGIIDGYIIPTYGNTMYMSASRGRPSLPGIIPRRSYRMAGASLISTCPRSGC